MAFSTAFARALTPVAIVAAAAPAVAKESPDMARVQAHLNAVQSMTATFTQTDARGRVQRGTLQLKRPGKVRFQYGSGDLLLVADGSRLHFIDYQVGQKSAWPLNRTPLGVLLGTNTNLRSRAQVMPSDNPQVVVVRARDPRQFGTLVLAFLRDPSAPAGLKLYGWTAIDAQNKRTTVRLANQRYNVAVPNSAFTFRQPIRKTG